MVRFHAEVLEPLLHGDPDGAAAPPEPDKEVRPKTALENIGGQPERIQQQIVGGDVAFVLQFRLARLVQVV